MFYSDVLYVPCTLHLTVLIKGINSKGQESKCVALLYFLVIRGVLYLGMVIPKMIREPDFHPLGHISL
jgi:hypothetical protein